MGSTEKAGYYKRLKGSFEKQIEEKDAEIKALRNENARLRNTIQMKDESVKELIRKVESLEQQYSEGILDLAEAQDAYRFATKELIEMKKKYAAEFRQAINRIRK